MATQNEHDYVSKMFSAVLRSAVELWNTTHYTLNDYREQMTGKKLRSMILAHGDWIIRNGQKCRLKSEHIAAGIYNIWFEPVAR